MMVRLLGGARVGSSRPACRRNLVRQWDDTRWLRTYLEYQHRDYVSRQKKVFAGRFVTWAARCVMAFQGARGGGKPV